MLKLVTRIFTATALAAAAGAYAQYPSKAVVMVVPFAAGGPTDPLARTLGLAMSEADLTFCQTYFRDEEARDPSLTEIRMLDTSWSDHCRHTTFLTRIREVGFEGEGTEGAAFAGFFDAGFAAFASFFGAGLIGAAFFAAALPATFAAGFAFPSRSCHSRIITPRFVSSATS